MTPADPAGPSDNEKRQDLARILFGRTGDPEIKIVTALAALVFEANTSDEFGPTVVTTRAALEEMECIARRLNDLTQSDVIRAILPNLQAILRNADNRALPESLHDVFTELDAHTFLLRIAAAVGRARKGLLPDHIEGSGGRIGNRRTLALLGHPTGRLMCAVAVAEALLLKNGRRPHEKSQDALKACDLLWLLAAGTTNPRGSEDDRDVGASWLRYIVEASHRTPDTAARTVARIRVSRCFSNRE
jgi:hypothetical protein